MSTLKALKAMMNNVVAVLTRNNNKVLDVLSNASTRRNTRYITCQYMHKGAKVDARTVCS
jgi:hypothetical protein